MEDEELRPFFEPFGKIVTCIILRDFKKVSKGVAFVLYEKRSEAIACVERGQELMIPGLGYPFVVKMAETKDQKEERKHLRGSRGGSPPPGAAYAAAPGAPTAYAYAPAYAPAPGAGTPAAATYPATAYAAAYTYATPEGYDAAAAAYQAQAQAAAAQAQAQAAALGAQGQNPMGEGAAEQPKHGETQPSADPSAAGEHSAPDPAADPAAAAAAAVAQHPQYAQYAQVPGYPAAQPPPGYPAATAAQAYTYSYPGYPTAVPVAVPVAAPAAPMHSPGQVPPNCAVFIYRLPPTWTDTDLYTNFGYYGSIKSVKVMKDPGTGQSRGFGFVNYENPDAAQLAISAMNGLQVGSYRLSVALKSKNKPGQAPPY